MERNNILIVAITRLGDMLQMTPTIVGLKRENPHARITVVIEKQFSSICSGIPGIDEVYVVDLSYACRCIHQEREGVVEAFKYIDEIVKDLKARNFDYALNMSNSAYTALLIKLLGIPENRGWLSDDEGFRIMADPFSMLFSASIYHSNRDFNSLNLVDMFRCGAEVTAHPHSLQYNVTPEAISFTQEFLRENGLADGGPLICLQAGASQSKRQWAPSKFAQLTKYLVEDIGARVVFTGSKGEQKIVDQIFSFYSHPRAVSSLGKTSFDQLAGLLQAADVLITGDTGPMHLSVAVDTPVVALFLASALCHETGPYSSGNFVIQPQVSCNPCNPNSACARPDCHDQITPELVAYLAKLRLETPMGQEEHVQIPWAVAHPESVRVMRSGFDEEGFLYFKEMNGIADRHGERAGFYEAARSAYRQLWKEEFAKVSPKRLPAAEGDIPEIPHEFIDGLKDAVRLTEDGKRALTQLRALVEDERSPVHLLGQVDNALQNIDTSIEELSLIHPVLGVLCRIFIMEKENLRGDDPLELANQTEVLYDRLVRRGTRFSQLFTHYEAEHKRGERQHG